MAATRASRAVGLLSRSGLEPGEALWIVPSRGVHTWGMRFTIDVLALDEAGMVIDCVSNLRPWRVRLPRRGTAGVLELPAGTLAASHTSLGHRILIELRRTGGAMTVVATLEEREHRHGARPRAAAPPMTIAETGLHPDTLSQLMLKTLVGGESSGTQLAEKPAPAVLGARRADPAHAGREAGRGARAGGAGTAGYRYALTDLGRERAMQFLDISRYVGPAPVPLAQYNAYVRACMAAQAWVDRDRLAKGFEQLIVNKGMYDQLGPAVNSGKSLFLYGAPGNGKTVVAEGIGRALGTSMCVPHAIDVDGQTITMYDPVTHSSTPGSEQAVGERDRGAAHDRRWERIRRPVVVVGGELTLEMLDLTFNPIAKFYEAPIQMKANGGVFVVDDFGRQRIPPRDLLNRWIVPLESRVDYLTLHTGRKFEIPFNVFIIFATNLKPQSLADEAFLRRIPYKIRAKNPTIEEYTPDLRDELPQARAARSTR